MMLVQDQFISIQTRLMERFNSRQQIEERRRRFMKDSPSSNSQTSSLLSQREERLKRFQTTSSPSTTISTPSSTSTRKTNNSQTDNASDYSEQLTPAEQAVSFFSLLFRLFSTLIYYFFVDS